MQPPQAETADVRLSTQHYPESSNAQALGKISAHPSSKQTADWKEVWKLSGLADDPSFSSKYEVIGEVGRGAMGLVLHGRHRVLNRPVAIKLMLPNATSDRFLCEAKLLATLNSPHVVTIYDYFLLNRSCPALVMEWVTGTTLGQRIKTLTLSAAESILLPWMLQTCSAMIDAESFGIVHRDLKPSNILIDANQKVKVADFGLARGGALHADLSHEGTILGTP